MLIVLTFAMSDSMSHTSLPRPSKREERPGGGVKSEKASGKTRSLSSCAFACALPFAPFLAPRSPLFMSVLMPRTSQQATAICMMWSVSAFLQLFGSQYVCLCLHVAVCIWVSLQVLICAGWLPASLSCKREKKKKNRASSSDIFVSQSHQGKIVGICVRHTLFFISCKVCGFRWGLFLGRSETASGQEKANCSTTEVMREI